MEFSYSYRGESSVESGASGTDVKFAPDVSRRPTFFRGELRPGVAFREAMAALHEVVVSDQRFKPRDKTAYREWLAQHEERELAEAMARGGELQAQITEVRAKLRTLDTRIAARRKPFLDARARFFKWLYEKNRDFWFVLDPVVTVHPDQISFECFSQDESSYGRVAAGYEVFSQIGDKAYGTTNVDYSEALANEFAKIRSYKTTRLEVDPAGFEVQTGSDDALREVKIDLPESWVRGFLQVSSAMTLPASAFELHPMDVHNLCFVLRRRKEKTGPRSIRWTLEPGKPVRAVLEPWRQEVVFPRSVYPGAQATEVRTWGRRRLLLLERLIPVARRFRVHLLGYGLPSFWIADLGDISFTLGLSGWTANDWAGSAAFDLLAPRAQVDHETRQRVFDELGKTCFATPDALAAGLGLDRTTVLSSLGAWIQAGRAIFDLDKNVFRVRELARDPLPLEKLRFASEREANAMEHVLSGAVKAGKARSTGSGGTALDGTVVAKGHKRAVALQLDADERIADATCTCNFYSQNKLRKGPCEHVLALRFVHARKPS